MSEADLDNAIRKQMAGIDIHQVGIFVATGHFCNDTGAHAEANISLDYIGVGGGDIEIIAYDCVEKAKLLKFQGTK